MEHITNLQNSRNVALGETYCYNVLTESG